MDIRELMARAWTINDELQEGAIELIAQGDCWDEEQCSNPSGAATFRQQEQPEDCENRDADGFPMDIGEEWKHLVEEPIPDALIEEEEQFLVKADERIQHGGIPFSETAYLTFCEFLSESDFL